MNFLHFLLSASVGSSMHVYFSLILIFSEECEKWDFKNAVSQMASVSDFACKVFIHSFIHSLLEMSYDNALYKSILHYAIRQQKKHKNSKYMNLKLVHLYTHSTHIICKKTN